MSVRVTRRSALKAAAGAACLAAARSGAEQAAPAAAALPYPDDAFSRPAVDRWLTFQTLNGCVPHLDVVSRAARYVRNDLRLVGPAEAPTTEWRVTPRDIDLAVLAITQTLRRAPESIRVRVRSRAPHAVTLWMDIHETAWEAGRQSRAVPWQIRVGEPLAPGEERTVVFPFAAADWPGRSGPAAPRFPTGLVAFAVGGLRAGVDYVFDLLSIEARYPDAPGLRCRSLRADTPLRAGQRCAFTVDAEGQPGDRPVDLEVRREPWVLWRVRLNDAERAVVGRGPVEVRRSVPAWLPPGPVTVGLVTGGLRAAGGEAASRVENPRRPGLPRAERRLHRGRPAMFLNGRLFPWEGYSSYDYQPGNVTEFGTHGATVLCVPACAARHIYPNIAAPTWVTPDRFDFGELDERVCFSLQANPRAAVYLRLALSLPVFWAQGHADERVRVQVGDQPYVWEEGGTAGAASLAGEAWRREQERALVELLAHCRRQPWADRLAGIWLAGEVTEEWFAWGSNSGMFADYSPANAARFARQAGGAAIPPPSSRQFPGHDLCPDTPEGRAAAAYHRYYTDLTADTIDHFASIVKRETGGRTLVGCFYGYVVELTADPRQATSGNFGVRRLIDSPHVDMLATVPLLDFRDLTNGYNPYCSATESILAAGKLFCSENDMFSWLHPLHWYTEYDPKDPRAGAIAMHRRECANDAVHGVMAQKFSLAASWHHDAALQAEFARQSALYARTHAFDRTPVEEIAFVVDDTTFAWLPPETTLPGLVHKRALYHLGRTGAPVGVWLLSDLDRLPARIRLVMVVGAEAAAPADIDRLSRLLARGGRTVVVVGLPGLVDPPAGRWRVDRPAEVLGLPVRVQPDGGPGAAAAGGVVLCPQPSLRPRAVLDGEGWMRYGDGAPAGGERALPDGGRLVWCGVPVLHTPTARGWCAAAGVHLYAPQEFFVHAAREIVAVTSPFAGEHTLRWTRPVRAEDLFDGWSGRGAEVTTPFAAGQTRLFRLSAL